MAYNQFPEHPDDSVGGWMLTLFLMGLPLVGFVYLLVIARRTHLADHLRTRGGSFLRSLRRSDYGVAPGLEYVTSRRTASVLVGRHPNHSAAAPTLFGDSRYPLSTHNTSRRSVTSRGVIFADAQVGP